MEILRRFRSLGGTNESYEPLLTIQNNTLLNLLLFAQGHGVNQPWPMHLHDLQWPLPPGFLSSQQTALSSEQLWHNSIIWQVDTDRRESFWGRLMAASRWEKTSTALHRFSIDYNGYFSLIRTSQQLVDKFSASLQSSKGNFHIVNGCKWLSIKQWM